MSQGEENPYGKSLYNQNLCPNLHTKSENTVTRFCLAPLGYNCTSSAEVTNLVKNLIVESLKSIATIKFSILAKIQ